MSPVDALDTMILMGMDEEAASTREYIAKNLSFDHDIYVKNFEITIRMQGGLLSTYNGCELRPEIIESAFYLYHFTNDAHYRAMGRTFFDSLVKYCHTDVAYAALSDVEKKSQKDEMESFFFAETLKYLHLLYAPPDTLDLKKVVFKTEAHPIRKIW